MGKKIESKVTLEIIEAIVEERARFMPWEDFSGLQIMEIEGFVPDFKDENYREQFAARIRDRIKFVKDRDMEKGGFDKLPPEAAKALEDICRA